jgi:transposase
MAPFMTYGIEQFGPDRCMFESNFPPDKVSFLHHVLCNAFKQFSIGYTASERAALLHDTAVRAYRISAVAEGNDRDDRQDPEPKAMACYGLLRADTQGMRLRFVAGRPVSAVTTQLLAWLTERMAAEGKTALLLVWDNASWHVSQAVRAWLKMHNRRVKQAGGCRVVVCPLPIKSPWLNRIEPTWVHGKRAIAEPERKLCADELKHRICAYYDCELLAPIAQQVA